MSNVWMDRSIVSGEVLVDIEISCENIQVKLHDHDDEVCTQMKLKPGSIVAVGTSVIQIVSLNYLSS